MAAEAPVIVKADPNAQAIMQLSVTSESLNNEQLTELVENTISERIAAVKGVADVQVYGTQNNLFEIDVNQLKLASLGLTVGDIRNALASISFDTAAGSINGANQNINVRALSEVTTPEQFENIIINGKTRLADVATVVFGATSSTSGLRSTARPASGLAWCVRRSPTPCRFPKACARPWTT